MNAHDRDGSADKPKAGPPKRIGTSVLVAAASLLGTSLGVAGVQPASDRNDVADASAGGGAVPEAGMRVAGVKVEIQTPHITVKTNQIKTTTTNQIKVNQIKTSNQIKYGDQDSNQIKYGDQFGNTHGGGGGGGSGK